jgi:hypothetical protein
MDQQFPWAQRWPEGTAVYRRYFEAMGAHGENMAEIWSAAWSLGLEWTPRHPGYHGVGQFNMMNAWEQDRVLEAAEQYGIYVNFVVHNHGKFSTVWDPEWDDNPFNVKNGGYLKSPLEYFTDRRALAAFRKLMRYILARWSYSTSIFGWELWSELNLVGSSHQINNWRSPELVEWHRIIGRHVKEADPWDHPIGTHVCQDYQHQDIAIISLPEMDFCPIDAYHGSHDPAYIVQLMVATANFNNPYGKPVVITEFGGSPQAQGLDHLEDALHAALWASPCVPLGTVPMFWWWQLIEEENFYPKFAVNFESQI